MKNQMNFLEKAKDGTVINDSSFNNSPSSNDCSINGRHPIQQQRYQMTLREFLSTKLPRKQPSPELLTSIREQIKKASS